MFVSITFIGYHQDQNPKKVNSSGGEPETLKKKGLSRSRHLGNIMFGISAQISGTHLGFFPSDFPQIAWGKSSKSKSSDDCSRLETPDIYNGKRVLIATDGRVLDTRLNGQMNLTNHLIQL